MIHDLIQLNVVSLIISVIMLLFLATNSSFDKRITLIFTAAIISLIILSIVDMSDEWLSHQADGMALRRLTSALGYALRPFVPLQFFFVVKRLSLRNCLLLSIPFALNAVISLTSIFTNAVFIIDDCNVYHRGVLGYLPAATITFYIVLIVVFTIQAVFGASRMKREFLPLGIMLIAMVFSASLELFFDYRFVFNPTCVAAVNFYYLFLHTQTFKRDPLTGLLNRRSFYINTGKKLKNSMIIVSFDANSLKKVNDNEGHAAGDRMLVTIARCIGKGFFRKGILYRTGGDEFMMTCERLETEEIERLVAETRALLGQTPYTVAIGWAGYEPGMELDAVCTAADKMMYLDKKRSKGAA